MESRGEHEISRLHPREQGPIQGYLHPQDQQNLQTNVLIHQNQKSLAVSFPSPENDQKAPDLRTNRTRHHQQKQNQWFLQNPKKTHRNQKVSRILPSLPGQHHPQNHGWSGVFRPLQGIHQRVRVSHHDLAILRWAGNGSTRNSD